jgi:hypothetical protein
MEKEKNNVLHSISYKEEKTFLDPSIALLSFIEYPF